MGQHVTKVTGGIEKTDINLDYETYGDGDTYAIDGNCEYQSSDLNEVEEAYDRMSTGSFKGNLNSKSHAKESTTRRYGSISMVIFCITMLVVCLAGGGIIFYFIYLAPISSPATTGRNLTS